MAYSAEISRKNPTCFLFLFDQSGSMGAPFGVESTRTKAEGVAEAINRILQRLVDRCTKGVSVLDRYHIGVIGYGNSLQLGFSGRLAGKVAQPVSELANNPLRIEERKKQSRDAAKGVVQQVVKFPVWVEPVADGSTPMCGALNAAYDVVTNFVKQYPGCFPPVVINVSDGNPTDGDPEPAVAKLRGVTSSDGNVLLFNIHISEHDEKPILYPTGDSFLPSESAKRLFRMSSPVPSEMRKQAKILEIPMEEGARGFAFNANLVSVVSFLEIGTRVGAGPV